MFLDLRFAMPGVTECTFPAFSLPMRGSRGNETNSKQLRLSALRLALHRQHHAAILTASLLR